MSTGRPAPSAGPTPDAVILNIVLGGTMQVEQCGASMLRQAGDFALGTADRPYSLDIPSHMEVGCFRHMLSPADLPNDIAALKALLLAQDEVVEGLREQAERRRPRSLVTSCADEYRRSSR